MQLRVLFEDTEQSKCIQDSGHLPCMRLRISQQTSTFLTVGGVFTQNGRLGIGCQLLTGYPPKNVVVITKENLQQKTVSKYVADGKQKRKVPNNEKSNMLRSQSSPCSRAYAVAHNWMLNTGLLIQLSKTIGLYHRKIAILPVHFRCLTRLDLISIHALNFISVRVQERTISSVRIFKLSYQVVRRIRRALDFPFNMTVFIHVWSQEGLQCTQGDLHGTLSSGGSHIDSYYLTFTHSMGLQPL